jgi:hypothetical protein
MHPDKIGGKDAPAVLRWKSPVDGRLTIKGYWENTGQGDGIVGVIKVDGRDVDSQQVGGTGKHRFEVNLPIEVKKGSLVDFVCNPGATTSYDATAREFTITQGKWQAEQ